MRGLPFLVAVLGLGTGCDQVFGISTVELVSPTELSGTRWQAPCKPTSDLNNVFCVCDNTSQRIVLGGTADQHYTVVARIRGVYEDLHYAGGSGAQDGWLIGGTVAIGDEQSNQLSMEVSAPAATYRINNSIGTNTVDLHVHDFIATFPVDGDAVVTFTYDAGSGATPPDTQERHTDENHHQITLPGEPWFDGQFAEVEVQSATLP